MRTWPRVTSTCASDQLVPTAKRNDEISSDPEKTKPVPKTAPRPLRKTTSAVTMAAAANIIAPPHQTPARASMATPVHSMPMRCNQGPSALPPRAHPPICVSVHLRFEAVLLADDLGPLGGASISTPLGPGLENDVVQRLVACLEVGLGRQHQLELAGRAHGAGASLAGRAGDAFLGLGLGRLPGLVLQRL